ncbi:MAG: restriction endonuclease subunit S, partial [Bacteroidaceae bacterium]|nr:restriction endonuclease subunit S [Bacteroidaceae bacterium]
MEVSEVWFSKLENEFRVDAEYYKKEYLIESNSLHKFQIEIIKNLCFVTDGQHGYYESDKDSNISMLAARNCKDYFANTDDALPLAKWVDDKNKRSSLQCGDIILSTRGSVGCCAIVYKEVLPANINQDVARIKLLETNKFVPEFIITYLNCKYGQHWMLRNQTGMVQQGLPLDKVRTIPIPFVTYNFQLQIEQIIKYAHAKLEESKQLYAAAEDQLLSELGLKGWQPKNDNINVKTLKESFLSSGRLDAEFYQSKYDEIENKIKTTKFDTLDNLCLLVNHGMQPPYVENGEMRVFSQKWIKDKEIDYS